MNENKKIVLSGYYGFDNLGDEAILTYLIKLLRKNNIEPIVLSANVVETQKTYGVEAVDRSDFNVVLETMKKADGLISGGGSLLQDKTSKKSLMYYLLVMAIAKIAKKPVYFYGQGVGPIKSPELKLFTRMMLKRTTLLSVRDEDSRDLLVNEIKVKKDIDLIHDPVLFMKKQVELPSGHRFSTDELSFLKKKPVYVSIRPTENDETVLTAFRGLMDKLEELDIPVISFPYHEKQDGEITKKLFNQRKNGLYVERKLTLEEASYILNQSRLVVGLRLHSLIMAVSQGTPFIGISYDPKIDALVKQFGYTVVGNVNTIGAESLIERTEGMLKNADKEKKNLEEVLNEMKIKNDVLNLKLLSRIKGSETDVSE